MPTPTPWTHYSKSCVSMLNCRSQRASA
ncbi:hypothetical protein, partial [Klebsiella pneumoniae]